MRRRGVEPHCPRQATAHNDQVGSVAMGQDSMRRRLLLAWCLTGLLVTTAAVVAAPVVVYLLPPAVSQMTIPVISVQNLDGPDVIVHAGAASALLSAGHRESWPSQTIHSNGQPQLVVQRADDGRILFQDNFESPQSSHGLSLIVRWPGLVWRTFRTD